MATYVGKKTLAAIGLGTTLVASAVIIAASQIPGSSELKTALINTSMQLIGAVVIGSAAKLVADGYQRQKQKYDRLQEFRGTVRSELVKAFSSIEQSRWILLTGVRHESAPSSAIVVKVYDEELAKISVARLALQGLKHQIRAASSKAYVYERKLTNPARTEVKARLIDCLDRMESYAEELNKEWTTSISHLPTDASKFPVPNLISEFIAHEPGKRRGRFLLEYELAIYILQSPSIEACRRAVADVEQGKSPFSGTT